MTSEKKIAANRANARKCTGPKSELGKLMASFNALKQGIYARSQLIPGENPDNYLELEKLIIDFYQPLTPIEAVVSRQLVKGIWRLGRLEQADIVAHKSACVAIVANDLRTTTSQPAADNAANEFTLLHSLFWEQDGYPDTPSPPSAPCPEDQQKWAMGPATLRSRRVPPAMAFLKSYTSNSNDAPASKIGAEIRTVTKHVLQLHEKLEAMQARRQSVVGQRNFGGNAEGLARSPEHSSPPNDQPPAEVKVSDGREQTYPQKPD